MLAYYTARPVDGGKLKGELILAPGTAVRALERDPGELGRADFVHHGGVHGTCFEVVGGDGKERMFFQAPAVAERSDWVEAVQSAITTDDTGAYYNRSRYIRILRIRSLCSASSPRCGPQRPRASSSCTR